MSKHNHPTKPAKYPLPHAHGTGSHEDHHGYMAKQPMAMTPPVMQAPPNGGGPFTTMPMANPMLTGGQ